MKTEIDIRNDIYNYLKDSALDRAITGKLCKGVRPTLSDRGKAYKPTGVRSRAVGIASPLATKTGTEDITIQILANQCAQMQTATINVNIYVSDLFRETWYEEDTKRLGELSRITAELLSVHQGAGFRFVLDSQTIFAVSSTNEHCINNQLIYKQINN